MLLNENAETETAEPKLVYCSPEDAQEMVSDIKFQLRGKVEGRINFDFPTKKLVTKTFDQAPFW